MNIKQNSLYGGGIPPFSWYINYIGKPLYKTARKLGLPKIGALAVANIPGSLSHVSGTLMRGDFDDAALWFGVSEVICTGIFYGIHKGYELSRKRKLRTEKSEPKNTLDDLIQYETMND